MIIRSISTPISRNAALSISEPEGAAFNPLSLFAAGEKGVWYDPSDMSTLFQDAAGTIPVTAAGQPVGKMLDKSGRGNHATQATATSRPVLQTANGLCCLAFDGVDDWMVIGAVDFTATNKMTVWAGLVKLSDAAVGVACELSNNINNNAGAFALYAPQTASASSYTFISKGTTPATITRSPFAAPHTAVLAASADIAAPSVELMVNTTTTAPNTSAQGVGNYGNYQLYIGRRGGTTLPFNGNLYSLIVRGVKSTAAEIANTGAWVNSKTGAY